MSGSHSAGRIKQRQKLLLGEIPAEQGLVEDMLAGRREPHLREPEMVVAQGEQSRIVRVQTADSLLHQLKLLNTGPAPEFNLELAMRLNLLTGDNSLGKSFLLDTAWYSLTRRWPQEINPKISCGSMAMPRDRERPAKLQFTVDGELPQSQAKSYECQFNLERDTWVGNPGRPVNPGIVLYAMADGSFAVWDPARNAWKPEKKGDTPERISPYVFTTSDLWKGLDNPDLSLGKLCNGLIQDWGNWQRDQGTAYAQLKSVLNALSPSTKEEDLIKPGPLVTLRVGDTQEYPSILMPDGAVVPVVQASSGVKRVLSIAYLLVWAWQEHVKACKLLAKSPAKQIILLIDEVESHLHPKWQRTVVRGLMRVVENLGQSTSVQLLISTHSPLVMASVEPLFDPRQDAWWDLDLDATTKIPQLTSRYYERLGDANSWLLSEAFDQDATGSVEAEEALIFARKLLKQGKHADPKEVNQAEVRLQQVLGATDPFWNRWRIEGTRAGWEFTALKQIDP